MSKKHDIGFAVYRPKSGVDIVSGHYKIEDMEEIVKYARVDCHGVPETGNMVCQKAGTRKSTEDTLCERFDFLYVRVTPCLFTYCS